VVDKVSSIGGGPGGGSLKAAVQPHDQFTVYAIVSAALYSIVLRESYPESWHSATI
jgi:vanillate/3-O-methylgallate O-demethylase